MEEANQEEVKNEKSVRPFGLRQFFEGLIANGELARLVIDGTSAGVVLPDKLDGRNGPISLHYGNNIPHPPIDMEVDDWGVRATLQFPDLGDFATAIPWSSVIEVSDMEWFLWRDRQKARFFAEMQEEHRKKLPPKYTKKGKKARRHLKLVQGDAN
jgi:hypothetical protein